MTDPEVLGTVEGQLPGFLLREPHSSSRDSWEGPKETHAQRPRLGGGSMDPAPHCTQRFRFLF